MTRQRNAAILTRLASELKQHGSWCGETHLQKAVYLMQELFEVSPDFEFILFKHGPFSFELRDELTALRGDGYFRLEAMPMPYGPKLQVDNRSPVQPPDIKDQVEECFGIAEKLGLEVLILNQTRPDVGLPVVKVIVPGLRHFWARFAPGRLYDVPVKMKWLESPNTEEDLNPTPMFI